MKCRPRTRTNQPLPEDYTTLPAQPFHNALLAGYLNSKTNIMKQRYITTGIIFGLLSVLNIDARAAYKEEWLSPQALQKEEAARSSHHPSAYACKSTGAHCNRTRSKTDSPKLRAESHDHDVSRADDPIGALAKKHDATRFAHRS